MQGRNPSVAAAQPFKSEMDVVCPRMLAWDAGGWGNMNLRSYPEWVSEAVAGSRAHVFGGLPGVRPKVSQELGPQEERRP